MNSIASAYVTEGVAEYVKTLFPEDFRGVCIDVGAFHPTWLSNSWIFEKEGWEVYCVEPNPHCIQLLKMHRKNVLEFACGEKSQDQVDFYIYKTPWAGYNTDHSDYWEGQAADTGLINHKNVSGSLQEVVKVNVRTLDYILQWNWKKFERLDYLSIDVEKNEMSVLRGFNINLWKPKVVVLENELQTADQHGWMASYGYTCINRITVNDVYLRESE